jgi:4-hydroxybenzoate polyprenyltransferase
MNMFGDTACFPLVLPRLTRMVRFLKSAFDAFVYGNLLISVAAASLTWVSGVLLGGEVRWEIIVLVFAATLFIYNFDRLLVLKSMAGLKSERHVWIVRNAGYLIGLVALSVVCMGYLAFSLNWQEIVYVAHLGLVSVLYSLPMFSHSEGKRPLRSFRGLKIFLIAYVWAATTAVLPALDLGKGLFDFHVILLFIERALFIFAVTLPFDIRDYKSDTQSGVITIPHVLGVQKSKWLAYTCTLVFMLLSVLHYNHENWMIAARMVTGVATLLVIRYTDETRHEYYYTGLIDGLLIIQAMLVWSFERIWE